jgi:hypothetical protein
LGVIREGGEGWARSVEDGGGFAAEFLDLAANEHRHVEDLVGGDVGEGTVGEEAFEFVLEGGEAAEFFFLGGKGFFLERFELGGAEGTELGLELAAPLDEGGFGDFKLSGDAGEAQALGAQEKELVFGFVGMHRNGWFSRVRRMVEL